MIIELKNLPNQKIAEIDVNIKFLQDGSISVDTETKPTIQQNIEPNPEPKKDTHSHTVSNEGTSTQDSSIAIPNVDIDSRPVLDVPKEMMGGSF